MEYSFEVIILFAQMYRIGALSNCLTFPIVVKLYATTNAVREREHVHYMVAKRGFKLNMFVGTMFIHLYFARGKVDVGDVLKVFDEMCAKNVCD